MRSGQVTIFVILGLLVMITFALTFYFIYTFTAPESPIVLQDTDLNVDIWEERLESLEVEEAIQIYDDIVVEEVDDIHQSIESSGSNLISQEIFETAYLMNRISSLDTRGEIESVLANIVCSRFGSETVPVKLTTIESLNCDTTITSDVVVVTADMTIFVQEYNSHEYANVRFEVPTKLGNLLDAREDFLNGREVQDGFRVDLVGYGSGHRRHAISSTETGEFLYAEVSI